MKSNSIDDYKIAVISNGTADGKLSDGELLKYGEKDQYEMHTLCFFDFCQEYYPEVAIFKRLTIRHTPEVYSYFLQDLGNIVFLNTTSETSIKKYGKTGMIVLPQNPSEMQKESLQTFAEELSDYHISIFYDLALIDGMVKGNELHSSSLEDSTIDMINTGLSLASSNTK